MRSRTEPFVRSMKGFYKPLPLKGDGSMWQKKGAEGSLGKGQVFHVAKIILSHSIHHILTQKVVVLQHF